MRMDICADCGRPRDERSRIFCVQCEVPLCNKCGFKLLCKTHFDQLPPEAQQKLFHIARKDEIWDKIMGFGLYLFIFCMISVFIMLFIHLSGISINLLILIPILPMSGFMLYFGFTYNVLAENLGHKASILQEHHITMHFPGAKFKCSVCGQSAPIVYTGRGGERPFQCRVCNKELCPNHYFEGFCPEHTKSLSQSIRSSILKNVKQSNNAINLMMISMFVGLGVMILFIYINPNLIFIGGVIIIASIVGSLIMICFFPPRVSKILNKKESENSV